jgi:diguanylate cyclase (GGDEF)-like protein
MDERATRPNDDLKLRPKAGAGSGLVLIADDDPAFCAMLARRAERMGLSVIQAEDGTKAIEFIASNHFDAVVTDLYMPGATGLEVVQAARRSDPELQAIILTGNATVETAIEALRAGAYDYLTKPLDSLAAFDVALNRALELRRLIAENKRLFKEVQRLAVTDPLTGLYNRHKLKEALDVEVERALRYNRPLSLIMIDLDNLKHFNDTHGHPAGDKVLQMVAQAIRDQVRKVDMPTRYGGDEFLVLLPEADLDEACAVADRIAKRINQMALMGTSVSASLGVAEWTVVHRRSDDILQEVDQALYHAKRDGGNTVWAGLRASPAASHGP